MTTLSPAAVEDLIATRRDFHRHPEVAFNEKRTSAIVISRMKALGLRVRENLGRTGLIADLGAEGSGPNIVLRAEMDALPVQEAESEIQSMQPGIMHACGHDAHTAIMLAVASELAESESLDGLVRFVFQPAEEIGAGARAMLEDGALEGIPWHGALAVHFRPFMSAGAVGICSDVATARVGEFTLEVTGTGGHGGRPHVGTDPLLAAAEIVTALQTLISREVSALDAAVLSVCSFHAGTAPNVIPDTSVLEGTLRSTSERVYEYLFDRLDQVASAVAEGLRCRAVVTRRDMMPMVRNDPLMVELVRDAAAEIVGPGQTLVVEPVMAGDDVALFFERIPGCYIFLGAAHNDGRPPTPNHSPIWDFDEQAMAVGASVVLGAVKRLMSLPPKHPLLGG